MEYSINEFYFQMNTYFLELFIALFFFTFTNTAEETAIQIVQKGSLGLDCFLASTLVELYYFFPISGLPGGLCNGCVPTGRFL